jgi:hypothetical protein
MPRTIKPYAALPRSLVQAVDDELTVNVTPTLIDALRQALGQFLDDRSNRDQGRYAHPLTKDQVRRLQQIERAAYALLVAIGPDLDEATVLLWETDDIVHSAARTAAALQHEAHLRLAYSAARHKARRPRDEGLRLLCLDVTIALQDAGEPTPSTRRGVVDRVVADLLAAAGVRCPRDLTRYTRVAIADAPNEKHKRLQEAHAFDEFDDPSPM